METKFTPIAMKCTQEQFEAIKPKLEKLGEIGSLLLAFENDNLYLVNNYDGKPFHFDISYCDDYNRKVHEEWNEEIFLKACGIESESLEQQLQNAEAEVKRLHSLIEEENKPKVGDWIFFNNGETKGIDVINSIEEDKYSYCTQFCCYREEEVKKITNKDLIKLLEQEIK